MAPSSPGSALSPAWTPCSTRDLGLGRRRRPGRGHRRRAMAREVGTAGARASCSPPTGSCRCSASRPGCDLVDPASEAAPRPRRGLRLGPAARTGGVDVRPGCEDRPRRRCPHRRGLRRLDQWKGMTPVDPLGPEYREPCDACGAPSWSPHGFCRICGASLRLSRCTSPGFRTTYRPETTTTTTTITERGSADDLRQRTARTGSAVEGPRSPPTTRHSWSRSTTTTASSSRSPGLRRHYLVTDATLFPDVKGWPPPSLTT